MGIPYGSVGKGNIFDFRRAQALKEMHDLASSQSVFREPPPDIGSGKTRGPIPWRTGPDFNGKSAIFDAEGNQITIMRTDLAERTVEAVNEFEGRIEG